MDRARLHLEHLAGRIDHVGGGGVERADLFEHQFLVRHRLRHGHRGAQRRHGRGRGAVDPLHQLDIVLFDQVEREIALHRHRHLGEQVGGPLAGIEQRGLADRLGLGRLGRVELVGLVLKVAVERLGDVDHLLKLVHRLPQAGALGVDRGIVHEQLVLAIGKTIEDRADVRLARPVFVEIVVHLVPERDDPEEFPRGHSATRFLGIERLDGTAKLGQVGADPGVAVDRLDRAVEESVRSACGLRDLLAAHRGQRIDLFPELGRIAVKRGEFVDELGDLAVEFAGLGVLQWDESGSLMNRDRLERLGRVELDLGGGRRGGIASHVHSCPAAIRHPLLYYRSKTLSFKP